MVPPLTRISLYPEHVTGTCPVILLGTFFYTFHESDSKGHAHDPCDKVIEPDSEGGRHYIPVCGAFPYLVMPGFLLGDPFLHLTIVRIAMLVTTGNGKSPALYPGC